MGESVRNVPVSSVNLDPRLYSDDYIPELVDELIAELRKPQPKAHVHQCSGCCARWDEDA